MGGARSLSEEGLGIFSPGDEIPMSDVALRRFVLEEQALSLEGSREVVPVGAQGAGTVSSMLRQDTQLGPQGEGYVSSEPEQKQTLSS